ncbi:hypothetical protein J7I93_14660 [Bacillus sp. ISL-47]|uniref:hypothetical protein n=1 Tax=Bacillus sp. ISL-47 TaxID=2819130 RepID=UPI001BE51934|nr:hypothetical protein [Bacillus sp. ISL-47]MBT2689432.1 hypothetical protein [Bacillus sp. ISL-47]MBT2709845.1 hypothetical protein [Pseudomonas sp. ISL-84]
MTVSSFLRFSGLCLIFTGILFVLFAIMYSISSLRTLASYVNLIGMLFLLLGIAGMYVRQMQDMGKFGFIAFLIYFWGAGMWTGFGWSEAFVIPVLKENAPHLFSGSIPNQINIGLMISLFSFFIGMLVFNLLTAVKAILPRWAALILVIVPIIDFIPIGNYLAQPLAGIAFIWLGSSLWNGKYEEGLK